MALVFEGDVCHDTCALDHAISTAAVHAYDQEVERKQAACLSTYLSWWFQTDGDCFHAGVPACVDGTCEVAGTDGPPGPDAPPAPPPGQ